MKLNLLLGIAAGVGVAIFLNSKKGQAFMNSVCDNAGDWMNVAKDALQDGKDKAQNMADDARQSARNMI